MHEYIGQRMKLCRQLAGLTEKQIAIACGDKRTVSAAWPYERGDAVPSAELLLKFAQVVTESTCSSDWLTVTPENKQVFLMGVRTIVRNRLIPTAKDYESAMYQRGWLLYKASGMSSLYIAERIGRQRHTLARYLVGSNHLPLDVMIRFIRTCGGDPIDFFGPHEQFLDMLTTIISNRIK